MGDMPSTEFVIPFLCFFQSNLVKINLSSVSGFNTIIDKVQGLLFGPSCTTNVIKLSGNCQGLHGFQFFYRKNLKYLILSFFTRFSSGKTMKSIYVNSRRHLVGQVC